MGIFGKNKNEPKKSKPIATEISGEIKDSAGKVFGGELKLYDVDDEAAVQIIAIVVESTDIPLNELKFKSIRAL